MSQEEITCCHLFRENNKGLRRMSLITFWREQNTFMCREQQRNYSVPINDHTIIKVGDK